MDRGDRPGGILIAGRRLAIDAATELLSPDNDADHWDVIEGQGSLFHPAYAGVSTGLLHGSQADSLVLCHAAGRTHVDGYPDYPLPGLQRCIDFSLEVARLTNPQARRVGISINTASLTAHDRDTVLAALETGFALPCFDPVATDAASLVETMPSA